MQVRLWSVSSAVCGSKSSLSFGGPADRRVMRSFFVEELKWVSERRFLHALNFCMLLPGPEAQQLTIYLGWILYR